MNIFETSIINIKPGTPLELKTTINTFAPFNLQDDREWPDGINLLLDAAIDRQAPLLPKFKGFRKTTPCELIATIYSDILVFKTVVEAIGTPQSQHEADVICKVAYKAHMQCIYAGLLCVELKAYLEPIQETQTRQQLTIRLYGNSGNNPQTSIYESYYKTFTSPGVAVFSSIGRTFKAALDMVSDGQWGQINHVITAIQALFRSTHELVLNGQSNYSSYNNHKSASERLRGWYLSRAQGDFLLLKIAGEYLTKGITGLEPVKPLKGLSIAKHKDIRALKRDTIAAIENGSFPIAAFELQDKAQSLFNDDPFDDFRFWKTFSLDDNN